MDEAVIIRSDNKFYIGESEQMAEAEITWVPTGEDQIIVDHTWVDNSLRGQGIARQLLERVVAMAREEQLTIIPTCSYARVKLEGDPQYADVLRR